MVHHLRDSIDMFHICLEKITLIIIKSDRRGWLLIMNETNYIDKMKLLMSSPSKFQDLNDVKGINMKTETSD